MSEGIGSQANPNDMIPNPPPDPTPPPHVPSGDSPNPPAGTGPPAAPTDGAPPSVEDIDFSNLTPRDRKVLETVLGNLHNKGLLLNPEDAESFRQMRSQPAPKEPEPKPQSPEDLKKELFSDAQKEFKQALKNAKTEAEVAAAFNTLQESTVAISMGLASKLVEAQTKDLRDAEYNRVKDSFFQSQPLLKGIEDDATRLLENPHVNQLIKIVNHVKETVTRQFQEELEAKATRARAGQPSFMELTQGRGSAPSGRETGDAERAKLREQTLAAMLSGDRAKEKQFLNRWIASTPGGN